MAAVIGDPVRHSLSPAIFNAAFRELAMDWVFVALPVAAGHGGAAVEAMRTLGIAGLSVTMPHKEAVAKAVDDLTPAAARLGAANSVFWRDGRLIADSTDGPGLLAALAADAGFDPAGRTCVVVGAGGAARAAVFALADAGADVVVVGRTPSRVEAAAALGGRVGTAEGDIPGAALVVNATPVGMTEPGLPVDPVLLHEGQLVVDMIYRPAVTPLISAARERGARAMNGLSMLVHQAAIQFENWTGVTAPIDAMTSEVTARSRR